MNGTIKLFGILFIPTGSLSNWIATISNFGQVLPLLLLTAPVLMMIQTFSNESYPDEANNFPTNSPPIQETTHGQLEASVSARRFDANVVVDVVADTEEELFSFQQYSQSFWPNHMIVLSTAGAILISWATNLCFTISAAFPQVLDFGDQRGSDYMVRTGINFGIFAWDFITLGHLVILVNFNFSGRSKRSVVLIWVFLWLLIAYMSWLCRGTSNAVDLWAVDSSAVPLWASPVLYAMTCVSFILYKRARKPKSRGHWRRESRA